MTHSTPDDTTERPSGAGIDPTTRHRLLADERRRTACNVLADRESNVHLSNLADAVASRVHPVRDADATAQVGMTLHHVHLPLLDDAGVVDYEWSAHRVTPRPRALDELVD